MLSTWKNFTEAVIRKFTNLHYCLPGGKLSKLCQEGSVSEYQTKFEEMCIHVLGLSDSFILKMYISGLRDDIQAEVLRDKPQDIHEAFELSLLVESHKLGVKGGYFKPFVPESIKSFSPSPKSDVPSTDTLKSNDSQKPPENKSPVFKRLSPAERKERASKGLCFNCDDKFSPGHKCKGRFFRLSADESSFLGGGGKY